VLVTNVGDFLPGDVETVIRQDAPQALYRNRSSPMQWWTEPDRHTRAAASSACSRRSDGAGSAAGLRPERVGSGAVSLSGRILDERYTRLLMERTDLDLGQVMLLDRVQKGQRIDRDEHRRLKSSGLVEGRYPNVIVASAVARAAGEAGRHIRERGFDKRYYLDLILALVREHQPVDRKDVDQLLLTKLPDRLSQEQKLRKVHNLLQELRRSGLIDNRGSRSRPQWVAVEPTPTEDAR